MARRPAQVAAVARLHIAAAIEADLMLTSRNLLRNHVFDAETTKPRSALSTLGNVPRNPYCLVGGKG
jgi:hypothetical protein